jgi:hypothetical protein
LRPDLGWLKLGVFCVLGAQTPAQTPYETNLSEKEREQSHE